MYEAEFMVIKKQLSSANAHEVCIARHFTETEHQNLVTEIHSV